MHGPGGSQWHSAPFIPSDKLPLVIFGDGMFGKKNSVHIRGHKHGVVDVLWKVLKQKEKQGQIVAIKIDEFLTSQVSIEVLDNFIRSSFQLTTSV
jgi:hypothetical protein